MKKILLSVFALTTGVTAFAQLNGDGYYRVKNYKTDRYVYVIDNKGKINSSTTSADVGAIDLWKGFDKAASDPASIIYIRQYNGNEYDLEAQATSVHSILGYYVKLRKNSDGSYYAYASESGMTLYLGDDETADIDQGWATSQGSGDYRKWSILPYSQADDQYFGILPECKVGDCYYKAFYASFPYSFASTGMKAYCVTKVGYGMAAIKAITTEVVPAATPVLIACATAEPTTNRLNIQTSSLTAPTGNYLHGVYFNNPSGTHVNHVAYDARTMRILGTMTDGSLGFVTATIDYIPANTCYLTVPAGSPAELKIVTEEEYATDLTMIRPSEETVTAIYDLTGHQVRSAGASTIGLPPGVYVRCVNGAKQGEKIIVY